MALNLSFENAEGYLWVRFEGEWTQESIGQGIQDAVSEAQKRGYARALWDGRKLSGPPTNFHRFVAGEQIAAAARGKLKIAAVAPKENINKFMEDTAVNRGAQIIVLSDFDEAVKWLVG